MMTYDVYRDDERKCSITVEQSSGYLERALFEVALHHGPGVFTAVEREPDGKRFPSSLAETNPELRAFRMTTEWLEEE